jgi:hypothetical protein
MKKWSLGCDQTVERKAYVSASLISLRFSLGAFGDVVSGAKLVLCDAAAPGREKPSTAFQYRRLTHAILAGQLRPRPPSCTKPRPTYSPT